MLFALAAVAALGFTSCGNSGNKGNDKEVLYSGILPSADADGSVYTLKLEFDADDNFNEGDFTLVENTLQTDTVAASGLKTVATSYTKGDFRKQSKTVDGATVEYIQLLPDAKDALGTPSAASQYFVINPDESLTMTGADLVKSETGLNYTLSVVK